MRLLNEVITESPELLIENSTQGKKYFIEGRFLQTGIYGDHSTKNGNGRIYVESVMDNAVSIYEQEYVSKNRAFSELNHPSRPTIDPERVCAVVKQLTKEGIHYNGKAQLVERSPLGQIVIGILEAGGSIGVSSRALGSLKEEGGIKYVQPDLRFTAIDVVSDPSGQGCLSKMVMEGVADKEYTILEDGTIQELVRDYTKKKINEEKAIKAFADFMIKIGK